LHLRPQLSSIRSRFGYPYHSWMSQEFNEPGWHLVQKSARENRFHDVTLLIEGLDGRFALMSKHSYPPGIFRSPSGGVHSGEDIAVGALREAHEETGLNIELKNFIANITLDITFENDLITWDSYIFYATTQDRLLKPTDLKEVKDTTWATPMQIHEMSEKLKETGIGGLIYRGNLTEFSMWALKNKLVLKPAKKFDLFFVEKSLRENKIGNEDLEKAHWWIAEVNTLPAATLGVIAREDCVELIGLTVDPFYHGRGVGQALIDYVCDQWKNPKERQSLSSLKNLSKNEPLWLITSNPGYYLNVDFEIVGHKRAPKSLQEKMQGIHEHDISMRHQIYRSNLGAFKG
jgi:8-oxo-dGTP pyrophosphatase MutT (NUDIX family)/N-acetylglutamate synthase-like GNAT family acetyltransferase